MLFDGASTAATTNTGFSLFGMTTSDSLNAIIAVLAFLGFGTSLFFSIKALNRTRKMDIHNKDIQEKQIKISLFESRYDLFVNLLSFFVSKEYLTRTKDNNLIVFSYVTKLPLLFDNSIADNLIQLLDKLMDYYTDEKLPLPDFSSLLDTPSSDKDTVGRYGIQCLNDIRDNMML